MAIGSFKFYRVTSMRYFQFLSPSNLMRPVLWPTARSN